MKKILQSIFFLATVLISTTLISVAQSAVQEGLPESQTRSLALNDTEEIQVFPSPTNGPLNVRIINGSDPVIIEVFDMLGNHVQNAAVEKKSRGSYTIDMSAMNKGLYFIKIQTTKQFVTRRVTLTN